MKFLEGLFRRCIRFLEYMKKVLFGIHQLEYNVSERLGSITSDEDLSKADKLKLLELELTIPKMDFENRVSYFNATTSGLAVGILVGLLVVMVQLLIKHEETGNIVYLAYFFTVGVLMNAMLFLLDVSYTLQFEDAKKHFIDKFTIIRDEIEMMMKGEKNKKVAAKMPPQKVSNERISTNKNKKNKVKGIPWILICLFILFIPPFLFSFYLFPPSERLELSREEQTLNNGTIVVKVRVSDQSFSEPTFRNLLKDALQIPFSLRWYDICFVDNDTKMVYKSGFIDKEVNVTINFNNNQTEFLIPYGKTRCTPYKFDKDFIYQWIFESNIHLDEILKTEPEYIPINETHFVRSWPGVTFSPSVDSYAKPEFNSLIVSYFIIFIAWFGIFLLFTGIYGFIFRDRLNLL